MIPFTIKSWSAWAPGVESAADWERFARDPVRLSLEGTPALAFIPAMQRRRLSRLSRMALHSAFAAGPRELLSEVSTVFASRHGESEVCIALLRDIARDLALSPTQFSHSVHNTQAGLFSIEARNACASTSIAAREDTFGAGLLEALGLCRRQRPRPCLLVAADEPRPRLFHDDADELPAAFGAAWVIEDGTRPTGMAFEMSIGKALVPEGTLEPRQTGALQFLVWMLGAEESLALHGRRCTWSFRRLHSRERASARS